MVENRILRANSRQQLGGGIFTNAWLMMGVVCLAYSAVLSSLSATLVGAIVVSGPLTYGLYRILRGVAYGYGWKWSDAITGFTESFANSLILNLLQTLFIFLWSLLLIVPGIVKSYSYAMAMYIQQDNPSMEANACIEESKKMMHGYKWQLFCLDFSFLGWYILGSLCFGVGIFFVTPYHQLARTNFYLALKAEQGILN